MNDSRIKTYGGFLPLELNKGKEWFDGFDNKIAFNSFKSAICYLISSRKFNCVYVPYYYCPSTIDAIKKTGCKVCFYHIDEMFDPILENVEPGCVVILVNYFGIKRTIKEYKMPDGVIRVFDFAHSFFEYPVMEKDTYNIYAPKKFFGIPDGGYLISESIDFENEKVDESYGAEMIHYLAAAFEEGTEASYNEKKCVDIKISNENKGMSIISHGIMRNVDYNHVLTTRTNNFRCLNDIFRSKNEIAIDGITPAYVFPLLVKHGKEIKQCLIRRKIFVPTLWSGEDLNEYGNEFEKHISADGIFLPIDQRYGVEDMRYLSDLVENFLNEYT